MEKAPPKNSLGTSSKSPDTNMCKAAPCPSCPYRKDTPKGVWALDHYEHLTQFDGDIGDQLAAGAFAQFGCHYDTGHLCRGWLDCHGHDNLLAMRISQRAPLPRDIGPVQVPVYESGQACLEANLPHMENPEPAAQAMAAQLLKLPNKKACRNDP
jgi:hypothetical protein